MLKYKRAVFGRGPRQPGDQFARVESASGNLLRHTQVSGIVPGDGRIRGTDGSVQLPYTWQQEVRSYVQLTQNLRQPGQHVPEPREIARGGLCKSQPSGMAAGTCADFFGFEDRDGVLRSKVPYPSPRRQARKSPSNHSKVHFLGQWTRIRMEVYGPRGFAPPKCRRRIHPYSKSNVDKIFAAPKHAAPTLDVRSSKFGAARVGISCPRNYLFRGRSGSKLRSGTWNLSHQNESEGGNQKRGAISKPRPTGLGLHLRLC